MNSRSDSLRGLAADCRHARQADRNPATIKVLQRMEIELELRADQIDLEAELPLAITKPLA